MKVVLSDANILIDLCKLELLKEFFCLDLEVFTTERVIRELKDKDQRKQVNPYVGSLLKIKSLSSIEVMEVAQLTSQNIKNLSYVDCEVWHISKTYNYTLLTGDKNLRNQAHKTNVEVRGILYIFDELHRKNIVATSQLFDKLTLLKSINKRLPQQEINNRLELYKVEVQK